MFSSDQPLLERILLWKRFIDDVLMLFRGTKADCETLVTWLNSLMPGTVKFKFEFSYEKIEFLDLEIRIEGGKLVTNLFIKPTNEQIYLDYNSNHPEHCKQGIPYSQALRIMERCATTTDRDTHFTNLESKLVQRNYPQELVTQQIARAKTKERKGLIFQQRKNKAKSDDKVRLIFTHGAANPPIHMWIREGKKLLSRNEQAKSMGDRIQICSKQPKNLLRIAGGGEKWAEGG